MKKRHFNISVALIVSTLLLHLSCDDEEEKLLAPIISSITPESGYPGTVITITGENFSVEPGGNTIVIGSVRTLSISVTATTIVVAAPANGQTRPVAIRTLEGLAEGPVFRYHEVPEVGKAEISFVDLHSAKVSGTFASEGSEPLIDKGFVYSKMPITAATFQASPKLSLGLSADKDFKRELDGLEKNQIYYVRTYCLTDTLVMGEEVNFTTFNTKTWHKIADIQDWDGYLAFNIKTRSGFAINNKGYLIDGKTYYFPSSTNYGLAIKEFDPETRKFERVSLCPGPARGHFSTFVAGDTVYLNGGSPIADGNGVQPELNDLWKYNVTTKVWVKGKDLQIQGNYKEFFTIGDQPYFVGNLNVVGPSTATYARYYRQLGAFAFPKAFKSWPILVVNAFSFKGNGYAVLSSSPTDVLFRYDPFQDLWSATSPLPNNEFHRQVLILAGSGPVFMINYAGKSWEYLPDSDTWIDGPSVGDLGFSGGFVINDRFYLVSIRAIYVLIPE